MAHPNRKVHPGIAPPAAGVTPQATTMFAVPDGVWNHGEGFGANYADHGAWHDNTDGTNLTINDVHVNSNDVWVTFN